MNNRYATDISLVYLLTTDMHLTYLYSGEIVLFHACVKEEKDQLFHFTYFILYFKYFLEDFLKILYTLLIDVGKVKLT